MNLVTFNPEQTLEDSFFSSDRFFGFPRANLFHDHEPAEPKVNVIEKDEAFHLVAQTPGMSDVSVEFHAGILTLKGHSEQGAEKNDYSIREFSPQSFERSFKLSNQIDAEKVTARMSQGILKITLPKKEQAKPKKIEIKLEP